MGNAFCSSQTGFSFSKFKNQASSVFPKAGVNEDLTSSDAYGFAKTRMPYEGVASCPVSFPLHANFHTSDPSQPGHAACAPELGLWPEVTDG